MKYKEKQIGGWTEYRIEGDRLYVDLKRNFLSTQAHQFPRVAFSDASGLAEVRDKEIAGTLQGVFTLMFIAVIFFHLRIETASWTLWGGMVFAIIGMIFGSFLAPKRRRFIAYSSTGNPILAFTEGRSEESKKEYARFIKTFSDWTKT